MVLTQANTRMTAHVLVSQQCPKCVFAKSQMERSRVTATSISMKWLKVEKDLSVTFVAYVPVTSGNFVHKSPHVVWEVALPAFFLTLRSALVFTTVSAMRMFTLFEWIGRVPPLWKEYTSLFQSSNTSHCWRWSAHWHIDITVQPKWKAYFPVRFPLANWARTL